MIKFLISATDGSEGAARAVAFAADLAKSLDAKLLLVHVSEDKLSYDELNELARLRISEGDALEEISRRILAGAQAVAHDHGAVKVETAKAAGDPAKVLMEIVETRQADAIVVGRRGRSQIAGLLLGSVSQKLTSLAPCAVIVVP